MTSNKRHYFSHSLKPHEEDLNQNVDDGNDKLVFAIQDLMIR